jgi:hypothetical protein
MYPEVNSPDLGINKAFCVTELDATNNCRMDHDAAGKWFVSVREYLVTLTEVVS